MQNKVRKNLKAGTYNTIEECLDDIQLIWTNCKYANKLSFQESSDSSSLNSFQKSLYCCEVKVARVISFSQPQHVAQIIDLAAQWKRVELTLKNCPNNSKVYFNVAQNGLIQYRNVQKTSLF